MWLTRNEEKLTKREDSIAEKLGLDVSVANSPRHEWWAKEVLRLT
jgi:hypothetical protein